VYCKEGGVLLKRAPLGDNPDELANGPNLIGTCLQQLPGKKKALVPKAELAKVIHVQLS
jgi:hypothetical protein